VAQPGWRPRGQALAPAAVAQNVPPRWSAAVQIEAWRQ